MSNAAGRQNGRTDRAPAGRKPRATRDPPAHGATVAFIVERLREDILAGRLEPGSGEREIRELFLIRIEMEALAARLAAAADASDRRDRFAASIEPIYSDAPRNPCDYLKENAAFHDAVMALADNLELRDLAGRLQLPLIMAQVGDVLTPPVLEASVREHRLIARAILDRDPAAASARMREHLERAAALALEGRAASALGNGAPQPARARRAGGSL
jgi:DNA-binding GntR family transcriptional regulator